MGKGTYEIYLICLRCVAYMKQKCLDMAAYICYVALSRPWSRQHGKLGTRPYIVSVTEIDSARNSVTQIHA